VLRTVEYVLNDTVNSETGTSAFLLRFGNDVETYMKLPSQLPPAEFTSKFVNLLDENLKLVRDISKTYQDELVRERTRENDEARQNRYCEGDMVLYVPSKENNPIGSSNKLLPTNKGPYEVISHENNVKCRHMSEHEEKEFHVENLKIFAGTKDDGFRMAMLDKNSYIVKVISGYRGDPEIRTTCEFYVEFHDGDTRWRTWNRDLANTVEFERFCSSRPELLCLLLDTKQLQTLKRKLRKEPIVQVKIGVKMRSYGISWYEQLNLPDWPFKRYMVEATYTGYPQAARDTHHMITIFIPIFNETYHKHNYWVTRWGTNKQFDEGTITKVNQLFVKQNPQLVRQVMTKIELDVPGKLTLFKVATWNVTSVRARHTHVKAYLQQEKPDVLVLQETKCINAKFPVSLHQENTGYHLCIMGQK
jgi:hypothetical protein